MSSPSRALCLVCGQEFEVDQDAQACPGCGDDGIPADPAVRPQFAITWHELRCLVMWAERFASGHSDADGGKMQRVVYGIADRLHLQHMDGPPLTFAQELAGLRGMEGVRVVTQNLIKELE